MICTECLIRGKDWEGSDPKCAFDNDEKLFSTDNWNCATMNKLRERADYHVNDDLNAASISVVHIPEAVAASDVEPGQGYIVMTFYKERGRTGQAWVMFDDLPPKPLTLELAEAVVRHYAPKEQEA